MKKSELPKASKREDGVDFISNMPDDHRSMKNPEPPKASEREDGVDFISNMPDCILLLILSRIRHTEEVIRSSILSRRWRYLWTSIPSLDINCFRGSKNRRNFKKSKFKEFVYWVLVNKSANLNTFNLCCENYYSMSTVGRWIHTAVMKNVKELELWFSPKEITEDIEMPHCLVTCGSLEVLKLSLSLRGLRFPNITGFPALSVLELTNVDLLEGGNVIKSFVESCPLLEDLRLIGCVVHELDLLCISCLNLKTLKIENDKHMLIRGGIKISCPKLVCLEVRGHIAFDIFFECLDSLKEAVIDHKLEGNTLSAVPFPGISRVESLSIDLYFFSECIQAAFDPGLPNLKTLGLKTTMDAFTMDNLNRILKCCPKLEDLQLFIDQDFNGKYDYLDEAAETWRILSSDVKRVEYFELNGEIPELFYEWFEDNLVMFFTWGDEARFLDW